MRVHGDDGGGRHWTGVPIRSGGQVPLARSCIKRFTPAGEPDTCLTQSAAESSMGVGDAPLTNQFAMSNSREELSLLVADSQQSTGNDYPQSPGWTKRVHIGRAPVECPPCVVVYIVHVLAEGEELSCENVVTSNTQDCYAAIPLRFLISWF